MKKLIDDPIAVVDDMIAGLVSSDRRLASIKDHKVVFRRDYAELNKAGKVAVISGGGAGHEPAHAGYVGMGMLTAAVIGPVFTSPSVDAVLAAIRLVSAEAGVLLVVKNYTGDRFNFGLAAEIARAEGIAVEIVVVGDDVALNDDGGRVGRRGIAGTIFVHKIAGAAAEAGLALAEVKAEAEAASSDVFSMGLGLTSCIVPAAGKPGFTLGDDEVEYGLGIHGENGVRRDRIRPAGEMIAGLLDRIVDQAGLMRGDRVALMVNNLGGSAALELDIVAKHALDGLAAREIVVATAHIGTFLTALEMAGCSLSLFRVDDGKLARLLAPTDALAWKAPSIPASPLFVSAPADPVAEARPKGATWPSPAQRLRFAACIRAVAGTLREHEEELTRLDSVVGDGDIGISLARGALAVEDAMATLDLDHPAAALYQISALLRRVLGGSSGPLYAVFVLRAAASLAEAEDISTVASWAASLRAGCDGMIALGKGQEGDRTMLDALLPAANALEASSAETPEQAAYATSNAGARGAQDTKDMLPKLGRSSYIGERVLGHLDPGAFAVALWLKAISTTLSLR